MCQQMQLASAMLTLGLVLVQSFLMMSDAVVAKVSSLTAQTAHFPFVQEATKRMLE